MSPTPSLPARRGLRRAVGIGPVLSALLAACGDCGGDTVQSGYPTLELGALVLDFGAVPEGTRATGTVELANVGLRPLHVTAKLSADSSPDFALETVPRSVAPGDKAALVVAFSPSGAGSDRGKVLLSVDDPENPEREVELRGGPIDPKLELSPDPLLFAPITGAITTREATLKNAGVATLKVTALRLSQAHNPDFGIVPPALPVSLEPGEEVLVPVTYTRTPKTGDGRLEVESDDPTGVRSLRLVPDPGEPPQCGDGLDNDGDGKTDHPADPGCSGPGDSDERDHPCAFAPSTGDDAQEPNDSRAGPNPVVSTPNGTSTFTYNLTLPPGDQDWFRLNIGGSGKNTTATAEVLCANWGGAGCGLPPTVRLDLYYADNVSGEQHDGYDDGTLKLARVQNTGPISIWFPQQRWLVGAAPSSAVCPGEAINATLRITVTNL